MDRKQLVNKKIVATIEARMTSSRLPGKVLMDVLGKPILIHMLERVQRSKLIDEIVIACTTNQQDDPIEKLCNENSITCFRGSEENVLERVLMAAQNSKANIIVELTGDCPLIDPQLIDQNILIFLNNNADYVSNAHIRSYPDGMDVQVFSTETLKKVSKLTTSQDDLEHVSLFIRNNPNIFSKINVISPLETHYPEIGITLDTKEDFELIKEILIYFDGKDIPSCRDIVFFLNERPSLLRLNSSVIRKGYKIE